MREEGGEMRGLGLGGELLGWMWMEGREEGLGS